MKNVIWGAGMTGGLCLAALGSDNVEFFIDKNDNKVGKLFCHKKVFSPESIKEWKDLHIYIPEGFYDEISRFLIEKGLVPNDNFEKYGGKYSVSKATAISNLESCLSKIEAINKTYKYVFWGWDFCGKYNYDKVLKKCLGGDFSELLIVSEAVYMDDGEASEYNGVDTIVAPSLFATDIYLPESTEDTGDYSGTDEIIEHTMEFYSISYEAAKCMVGFQIEFISKLLDKIKPEVIWGTAAVLPTSQLIAKACQERGIKLFFTHPGILPYTYSIDIDGDMGESWVAKKSLKFARLGITAEEKNEAKKIIDYIYTNRLNRKIQPKNNLQDLLDSALDKNRPIVFFAGQNDVQAHMIPYNENTQRYHSPVFKTSIEAVNYLAEICENNKWNLIFKPHPMYKKDSDIAKLRKNIIYIESADINELIDSSDLVITIVSQTNYAALIRKKPVLMLGYTHTKDQGCTYEAFSLDDIEKKMNEAIKYGYTNEQQKCFEEHIARLIKYYLYDDYSSREFSYGRHAVSVEDFFELKKLLE